MIRGGARPPDLGKAGEILGWSPTTSLENRLGRTIAHFDRLRAAGAASEVVTA